MMLGWYRKAVKRLGHEPISFEQLTTPGARGHEKPALASAIEHTLFATAEKTGNLRHRRFQSKEGLPAIAWTLFARGAWRARESLACPNTW